MERSEGKIGMKVYFGRRNGEKTLGEIVKINSKNFKVKTLEERGVRRSHRVGGTWTVPPSLCEPAEGAMGMTVGSDYKVDDRPCLVNVVTGKRTYGRSGESHDSLFGRLANGLL